MEKNFKLILFDLDNTLYNFKFYWEKSLYYLYKTLNLKIEYEVFVEKFMEIDKKYWQKMEKGECTLIELRINRLCETLEYFGENISREHSQKKFEDFFDSLILMIEPDEKVIKFLSELSKIYKIGILTNGNTIEQKRKIQKLSLDKVFSDLDVLISEELGVEKPNVLAFEKALLHFNVKKEEVIYVGDSIVNDIIGATNAGIKAILYKKYIEVDEEKYLLLKEKYTVIDELSEIFYKLK